MLVIQLLSTDANAPCMLGAKDCIASTMPVTNPPASGKALAQTSEPLHLRQSRWLKATPPDTTTQERVLAGRTWQVMRVDSEQALRDRLEIDKLDRALVTSRKQLFAAKTEAEALKQGGRRLEDPVVWGLAGLAAVSLAGWIWQRRQLVALRDSGEAG